MTIQDILNKFPNTKESDWHKHSNGGGWVQNTAIVEKTAYVGPNALVYGNAEVCGRARVCEGAQVYGRAYVCGNAQVYGRARVSGSAEVCEYALVCGNAQVYGRARVSGSALVYGYAKVYGNARVYGNAGVSGNHRLIGGKFQKSPIYIQGTKHAVFQSSDKTIGIGCKDFDIKTTKKELMEVAKEQRFTKEEIEEYEDHWKYLLYRLGVRKQMRFKR